MRVYFRYALRETGANLFRNPVMTIAAVLTVFVSLSLFGGALYLKQVASQAEIVWQQQTTLTVWMKPTASTGELASIKTQLAASPYVRQTCQYHDKQQNYDEAKELTASSIFLNLTPGEMVTSYICQPKIPANVTILIATFKHEPGIYAVTAPSQQVKDQERAIDIAQIIFFTIALVMLASAAVLIWNTIRLAIFARRRELSVMKLVGATNWFIRIPYIFEGFVQGVVGSILASAAVLSGRLIHVSSEYQLSVHDLVITDVVILVVGVLIGSIGSGWAIRRFLDV
jgi:cell division transport system permease protein